MNDYIPSEQEQYELECLEKCQSCEHWRNHECYCGSDYCDYKEKRMTNTETLEILKEMLFTAYGRQVKALDMAISALSADVRESRTSVNSANSIKTELEPCEDCISRQAMTDCYMKWRPYMATRIYEFEKELFALPSVQPKKGEWINAKVGKLFPSNDYKCSICGNILDFNGVNCGRGDANFCPNCGAKMSENPTD